MREKKMPELVQMGAWFKDVRIKCGFTQEQIANFLELDRTTITKFEKGERTLGVSDLEIACELFGCTLDMLRNLEEFEPMAVAYRAKDLTLEDMESVRMVQKIILNMRRIREFGKENDEINYKA